MVNRHFNRKASERLRIKQVGGHDTHVIEADNPRSLALLARAYKEVYEAAFPIAGERETLEAWQNSLHDKNKATNIVIVVAGDNLDAPDPTLKAISVAYYYKQTDAGLMAYNAVAPAFQGQGLGRTMVDARKSALHDLAYSYGKPLGGIFIECHDPAKVTSEEDVMDPALRIKMFEKMGAITLPVDYVEPPFEEGGRKSENFKLLAYAHPGTGKYPTKAEIKDYLTGIYAALARFAKCAPEDNADYLKSVGQLDKLDLDAFYKTVLAERKKQTPKPPAQKP
ncbi:MAG: hypothetical protein KGL10_04380 [Alphaproteobacteria bacterium]|nr:hypothetical protein [Alphaproteobacteria bacterium]